jgi:predicted lipoprotein
MVRIAPLLGLAALLTFWSCDSESAGNSCQSDFDQRAYFTYTANELIRPAYAEFATELAALETAAAAFTTNPTVAGLTSLRAAFGTTYRSWQGVELFLFGPAQGQQLREAVNPFPANPDLIDANLANARFDAAMPGEFDRGLPALDYLLYGTGADEQAVVDFFTADGYAATYLEQVIADMASRTEAVVTAWADGYRETFVANTGTAAGTSLSLIINALNEHYEITKRDRLGIPAGVVTLGFTNPEKVEAFYSQLSLTLLEDALAANERFYLGTTPNGNDGLGLDEYLADFDALREGEPLPQAIRERYGVAQAAVAAIAGPLSEAVDRDASTVQQAYTEVVRQIVQIKTDLPSVMCVAITYVDNPSDSD